MSKIEKQSVVKSAESVKKNMKTDAVVISKKLLLTVIVPAASVLLIVAAVLGGYLLGTAGVDAEAEAQVTPKKIVVVVTPKPTPTPEPTPTPSPTPSPEPEEEESSSSSSSHSYGRLQRTRDAGTSYYESLYYVGGFEISNLALYTGIPDDHVFAKDDGFTQVSALTDKRFLVSGHTGFVTVPEAMGIIKPKAIVMSFGYNGAPYMSVDTYIFHYEKLIDAILKESPDTKIIITMLNPITYGAEQEELTKERDEGVGYYTNAKIADINAALQGLAIEKRLYYLATDGVLHINDDTDSPLDPAYAKSDGQKLNRTGCERVARYIREHKLP
ncbi:MAG: SGNH/GDSL hydrolase family protein [Eubacteriales bacterium]